jgi:8-oxo-dGTP diphosphatase
MNPRHTARGIVVKDGQLLLMERWRPGKHYFSVPGGGIEPGEQTEEAVVREILEETGVRVAVDRLVFEMHEGAKVHHFYLCEYLEGEPALSADSPEAAMSTSENQFKPGWQAIEQLDQLPFIYWAPIKDVLSKGLHNGFPPEVTIVTLGEKR